MGNLTADAGKDRIASMLKFNDQVKK